MIKITCTDNQYCIRGYQVVVSYDVSYTHGAYVCRNYNTTVFAYRTIPNQMSQTVKSLVTALDNIF